MAQNERIVPVDIETEMKDSYLDYSMSVIVSRALPDVRDGLKPVHRRILYAMNDLGLSSSRAYKKSARIVGEVLGKYHPHGDSAVYDSMVRMVQTFSLRYPLVDGQGNFGSVDGDSAAAMRYTEARLSRVGEMLLTDIDKNTVDFTPNFDDTLEEPKVLPSFFPNLLVNGTAGIAVGMATNIPPHNLGEVLEAAVKLIDNPETGVEELMKSIPAPDFPTGAIICDLHGVLEAYKTGKGKIIIRARANVEQARGDKENIIITEIPYQVNKSNLIEKIAENVKAKKLEGVYDIRDESDRDGMRVVIELKKDVSATAILNYLYKHTQMQVTFGVINIALVNGVPRILSLKELITNYLDHCHDVVVRRTKFDLAKSEERAHILEGLKIALDHIDEIIALIKKSKSPEIAKIGLMKQFKLSERQAKAILEMRLQRLTGLERKKIEDEYRELIKLIEKLRNLLKNKALRMAIIKEELTAIKEKYADPRRTEIVEDYTDFSIEDMIADEDMVITISRDGFIKRFPASGYRRQIRGGRGSIGAGTKEEDDIKHLFVASTHHYMMFFSDKGRCYWLKVHAIPQAGKASKGRAIVNLIQKSGNENITAFVAVKQFDNNKYLMMATRNGVIKKTGLGAYSNPRKGGIQGINLQKGDILIDCQLTDGTDDVVLGTYNGLAIRFHEMDVRSMGRTATGVRGIKLGKNDYVVGMVIIRRSGTLLAVTENGYGKRSDISDYRVTKRGGKGIITIKTTERVGKMVAIMEVVDDDDLMIITSKGILIRLHIKNMRTLGRNTQGVRLIRLDTDARIGDVTKVVQSIDDNNDSEIPNNDEESKEEE